MPSNVTSIAFCHLDPPLILLLRLLHLFESCFTIWRQKVKLFEITYIVSAFIYVNLATQHIWEYNQLVECWHQTCSIAVTRPSFWWFIIKLTDPYTKKDHFFDMFIKSIHLKTRACHIYLILNYWNSTNFTLLLAIHLPTMPLNFHGKSALKLFMMANLL